MAYLNGNKILTVNTGQPLSLQSKTVDPSTTAQTITADSGYTALSQVNINAVTSSIDSNIQAQNIVSGITILGVEGTASGGGGEDKSLDMIQKTISKYIDINGSINYIGSYAFRDCTQLKTAIFPECLNIFDYAFYGCWNLSEVSFPKCVTIGSWAFYNSIKDLSVNLDFPSCITVNANAFSKTKFHNINLPNCTSIGNGGFYFCEFSNISAPNIATVGSYAFYSCPTLQSIYLPSCTTISTYAFGMCDQLETVSLPICTSIGDHAFYFCQSLFSLYLTSVSMLPYLANSNVFGITPIVNSKSGVYGSIYVPASLYESFKTANNWSYFSDRFVSV